MTAEHGARIDHYSVAQWRELARCYPQRKRALILSSTASAAVHGLGGWLFDQNSAGWDVTVLVGSRGDEPALAILGAHVLDIDAIDDIRTTEATVTTVAIGSTLYTDDAHVRALPEADTRGPDQARTLFFGYAPPADLADTVTATTHRISIAARAFKAGTEIHRWPHHRTGSHGRDRVGP